MKTTLTNFFESNEILGIHCKTKKQSNKIRKEFIEFGKKNSNGYRYSEKSLWGIFENEGIYLNNGSIEHISSSIIFDHELYEFEDIIFVSETINATANGNEVEIDEVQLTIIQLNKLFPPAKPKVWKPVNGERYFFINGIADIHPVIWSNDPVDKNLYSIGNAYRTKELCELAIEKKILAKEICDFALNINDGLLDWHNQQQHKFKYCFDFESNTFEIVLIFTWYESEKAYFTSEKACRKCIDKFGDRIIEIEYDMRTNESEE